MLFTVCCLLLLVFLSFSDGCDRFIRAGFTYTIVTDVMLVAGWLEQALVEERCIEGNSTPVFLDEAI